MNDVAIEIPESLRPFAGGASLIPVRGTHVDSILSDMSQRYPELGDLLITRNGTLHGHVSLFVNGEDMRSLPERYATPVAPGDSLMILRSVAGG